MLAVSSTLSLVSSECKGLASQEIQGQAGKGVRW